MKMIKRQISFVVKMSTNKKETFIVGLNFREIKAYINVSGGPVEHIKLREVITIL